MSPDLSAACRERLARNQAFWAREPAPRPLLGIQVNITFPMLSFPTQFAEATLTPEMIHPEDYFAGWDRAWQETEARREDLLMVASPLASVPWMEAIAGCQVRVIPASGSIWAEAPDPAGFEPRFIRFNPQNPWLGKLVEFARALRDHAAGCYPVGNPILRGVSDIIAAILGPTRMVLESVDHPRFMAELCERCAEVWHGVAQALTSAKGSYHGGSCADRRRIWGSGVSLLYQDDAVALASPRLFREYFLPRTTEILRPYNNTMIHLHSATLPIVARDLCSVAELRALEVLLDPTGPAGLDLLDTFREILRHKALVICGEMDTHMCRTFEARLPSSGLCLQPKVATGPEADLLWRELRAEKDKP